VSASADHDELLSMRSTSKSPDVVPDRHPHAADARPFEGLQHREHRLHTSASRDSGDPSSCQYADTRVLSAQNLLEHGSAVAATCWKDCLGQREELVEAIEAVARPAGFRFHRPGGTSRRSSENRRSGHERRRCTRLTPREREVLAEIASREEQRRRSRGRFVISKAGRRAAYRRDSSRSSTTEVGEAEPPCQ
jgi:hypothetical protein